MQRERFWLARCHLGLHNEGVSLEPWIFARLALGVTSTALLLRGAFASAPVIALSQTAGVPSEETLGLERQAELSEATSRVGAWLALLSLLASLATANHLGTILRGAMCGYGVVHANEAGAWSLALSLLTTLAAGVHLELLALDRSLRSLVLLRAVAVSTVALTALSVLDLSMAWSWLSSLDLGAVASCCSSHTDDPAGVPYATGDRLFWAGGAVGFASLAVLLAWLALRSARRGLSMGQAMPAVLAFGFAVRAIPLQVAPYVFETPLHRCPYCLFRADVLWIGYPLYAALLWATIRSLGVALGSWLLPPPKGQRELMSFAFPRLRAESFAWGVALALACVPIVRYWLISPGARLF